MSAVRLIRLPELLGRLGVGRSMALYHVQGGLLPPPVKLGHRSVAWPDYEIDRVAPQLANIHAAELCAGEPCCIHNPSDHHMASWPMNWRSDRHLMERICPHGIGHPDPDHMRHALKQGNTSDGIHGCDGCCVKEATNA